MQSTKKRIKKFLSLPQDFLKMDIYFCPFFFFDPNNFFKKTRFFSLKHNAVNMKFLMKDVAASLKNYIFEKDLRRFFCSHIIGLHMTTNLRLNKNPKYICEICNFKSSKKSDYTRHLTTAKHIMTTRGLQKSANAVWCECGKVYSCRQNLYRHRVKCAFLREKSAILGESTIDTDEESNPMNAESILNVIKQNQDFKDMLFDQSRQLHETHEQLMKSNEQNINMQLKLLDAFKDGKTIVNTTNNNQKFNLNFFLNTTCKDAMNMSEFIENINIDFKDIENIGKNGYINGMTDMILSRIKDLDVTKRPVHCTDLKRETMYIKDNDEWSKDTPTNSKLRNLITIMGKHNCGQINRWREHHPESLNKNHPQYEFCLDMMKNILGDVGESQIRMDNKVIKNLSRHILVDKT